tara:strand:- start:775 stop:960 length:186 start_codon:yes stop_codon:yes gene_type:complete
MIKNAKYRVCLGIPYTIIFPKIAILGASFLEKVLKIRKPLMKFHDKGNQIYEKQASLLEAF